MSNSILIVIGVLLGLGMLVAAIWLAFAWEGRSQKRRRSRLPASTGVDTGNSEYLSGVPTRPDNWQD